MFLKISKNIKCTKHKFLVLASSLTCLCIHSKHGSGWKGMCCFIHGACSSSLLSTGFPLGTNTYCSSFPDVPIHKEGQEERGHSPQCWSILCQRSPPERGSECWQEIPPLRRASSSQKIVHGCPHKLKEVSEIHSLGHDSELGNQMTKF